MAVTKLSTSGLISFARYNSMLAGNTAFSTYPAFLNSAPLWLDASDSATITQSSGSVSQWDNKGTLENFVQATGASQPTTNATTLNGLNVIDFASDFMNGQTLANWKFMHDGTDYFIASVVKYGTVANPNAYYVLIGSNGGTSNAHGVFVAYDNRTGIRTDAQTVFITRNVSASSAVSINDENFLTPNDFIINSMLLDPDNATAANRISYFSDNIEGTDNNAVTNAPSTSNPSHILQLGAEGRDGGTMTGSIAELIVVSGSDATETNRQATVDYLNTKWSVF